MVPEAPECAIEVSGLRTNCDARTDAVETEALVTPPAP
jgi:hypothetical protein